MDMEELFDTILEAAPKAMEETYWLCIFAVNPSPATHSILA